MSLTRASAGTIGLIAGLMVWAIPGTRAQAPATFNEDLLKAFSYRNIGPFRMQVRVADIAVPDSPRKDHLYTIYQAPWIVRVVAAAAVVSAVARRDAKLAWLTWRG